MAFSKGNMVFSKEVNPGSLPPFLTRACKAHYPAR